jgi:transposase-like protein
MNEFSLSCPFCAKTLYMHQTRKINKNINPYACRYICENCKVFFPFRYGITIEEATKKAYKATIKLGGIIVDTKQEENLL